MAAALECPPTPGPHHDPRPRHRRCRRGHFTTRPYHPPHTRHTAPDRAGSSLTCGPSAVIGRDLDGCGRVAVRARAGTQEALRLAAARYAPIKLLAGRLGIPAHLEAEVPRPDDGVCFTPGCFAAISAMPSNTHRRGGPPKPAARGPGCGGRYRAVGGLLFARLPHGFGMRAWAEGGVRRRLGAHTTKKSSEGCILVKIDLGATGKSRPP